MKKIIFLLACLLSSIIHAEKFTVALIANNNEYLEGAFVSAASVLSNRDASDDYHIYIFTTEKLTLNKISEDNLLLVKGLRDKFLLPQDSLSVEYFDEPLAAKSLDLKYWGFAGAARIFFPSWFQSKIAPGDVLFYMDTDLILVEEKGLGFYRKRFSDDGKLVMAVEDVMSKDHKGYFDALGFSLLSAYVNSGFLVMDIHRLNQMDFEKNMVQWLMQHPDAGFPDQDALNAVANGNISVLNWEYAWHAEWDSLTSENRSSEPIHMFHALGNGKPWRDPSKKYENTWIYNYYLKHLRNELTHSDLEQWIDMMRFKNFYIAERVFAKKLTSLFATVPAAKNANEFATWLKDGALPKLKEFLESHPDFTIPQEDAQKLLALAVKRKNLGIFEFLLKRGARIDRSAPYTSEAYELALKKGSVEVVELLLKQGFDINKTDSRGMTGLMVAVQNKNANLVRLFLANKADRNFKGPSGKTALEMAQGISDQSIITLF